MKALLIASASHYALLQACEALREDHGVDSVGVLCHAARIEISIELGGVHVWPDDGRFRPDGLTTGLREEIERASYELAVAVYASVAGVGYENVDALLAELPAARRLAYDAERDEWLDPAMPDLARVRARLARERWDDEEKMKRAVARIRTELGE